jgi:hypothetical protein
VTKVIEFGDKKYGILVFGAPIEDFAADIDAVQKCNPHRCDFRVFDVTGFQKQIKWNSSDKYEQVNKLARQLVQEGVTKYIFGGLKGLGSYTDRDKLFNLYHNMKSMLDSSYLPARRQVR